MSVSYQGYPWQAKSRLGIGVLTVRVVVLGQQIARLMYPLILPVDGFVEYWTAGCLNAACGNPYAPD